MTQHPKQWLLSVSWESVVNLNRALCQSQKLEALTRPKALDAARRLWEQAGSNTMLLRDALKVCHDAFQLAPFTFNNGNTFASVARALVEEPLKCLPPVEAQILRTTIGHYVAGKCKRSELDGVLEQLGPMLSQLSNTPPASPVSLVLPLPQGQQA